MYIKTVVLVPMLLRQTGAKMDGRLNGSKSDGKKKVIETSKSNQEKNNVA